MENSEEQNLFDKYTEDKINEALDEKELKKQWRKEIEENEAMQNYFKSFNSSSVKIFIDNYINNKIGWMRFGDFYKEKAEREASQWIELAHEHLQAILQKKLFDIQCLWRAEQVQLEGVEICFDFTIWEKEIWDCPFIEPITAEDIAMYSDYLQTAELQLHDCYNLNEWQNYEEIKESYQEDTGYDYIPEWYEFHNNRTGNASLLLLPDTRGEKEKFYQDLYFNSKEHLDKIAEHEANKVVDPDFDARPNLDSYPKDNIDYFVKTFEDRTVQLKHKYYSENCRYGNGDAETEYYDELFREVLDIKEPFPIEAHHDFREAVAIAYNRYRCRKIAENMPIAFEQYLFNKKMGFLMSEKDKFYRSLRSNYTERFIKARILNGEAPNLDF
jgi:hypothetical protein